MKWARHVSSIREIRKNANNLQVVEPTGRSPRGWPSCIWEDNIREMVCGNVYWIHLAHTGTGSGPLWTRYWTSCSTEAAQFLVYLWGCYCLSMTKLHAIGSSSADGRFPQPSTQLRYITDSFHALKRPGCEAHSSLPSSARLRKWIFASAPPYVFVVSCLSTETNLLLCLNK
jgi:hypothetical protein